MVELAGELRTQMLLCQCPALDVFLGRASHARDRERGYENILTKGGGCGMHKLTR